MTQAINEQALREGNPLMSEQEVATLPECELAYTATVAMSQTVAGV